MTCEQCLCGLVCSPSTLHNMYENKAENCPYFKNKADFIEVKHGRWIDDIQTITTVAGVDYNGLVGYKCSICGRREGSKEPYCNCGAKMDSQL